MHRFKAAAAFWAGAKLAWLLSPRTSLMAAFALRAAHEHAAHEHAIEA